MLTKADEGGGGVSQMLTIADKGVGGQKILQQKCTKKVDRKLNWFEFNHMLSKAI